MIQILKLGLPGVETTLPTESRINNQGNKTQLYQQASSINGTIHTDFIGTKDNWTITWDVLSEENVSLMESIIQLQYTGGTHLSFIYTNSDGTEMTQTVFAETLSKGALIQRDEYFTRGYGIGLKQC